MRNSQNLSIRCLALTAAMILALAWLACASLAEAAPALLPVPGVAPSPDNNPASPGKTMLGMKLFFDRRLSGDGTMSCANCHLPESGFSDAMPVSFSYPTTRNWRNSPTLINAGFSRALFHDGRASSLEEQALFPMMSAFEMNQNLDYLEEELRSVDEYASSFEKVFGGPVTRERIAMAIAAFERTLVSMNSPLDRFLKGDRSAMSGAAMEGYEIFAGKGGCIKCHNGVNLSDGSFHNIGVPENARIADDPGTVVTLRFVAKLSGYADYVNLKEDIGRHLVTGNKEDWKAFRTPTLREVSRTGPYMHNGVFETLDEVIDFIDRGGGNTVLKPLGLTSKEKASLRAFLEEALTGDEIRIKVPRIP